MYNSHPETALHLNVKFHIYHQLLKAQKIYIEKRCDGFCNERPKQLFLEGWDEVKIEYQIGSIRPDISLFKENSLICAIEVLVSHEMSKEKKQYLINQEIPWIEIKAEENLYIGNDTWNDEKPLPFYNCYPEPEHRICDNCKKLRYQNDENSKEIDKKVEHKKYNCTKIHAAKMVDYYFPSGKKYREVYFVKKKLRRGDWVKVWIETERNRILATEYSPITKDSMKKLSKTLEKNINSFRSKGAIVDNSMKWRLWENGSKFVARDIDRFPFRYGWDSERKVWVKKSERTNNYYIEKNGIKYYGINTSKL
ncbi:hypothetical protein [Flexistipes sp.]|uniref:hypothetical protein n=1 Tax=Flexistipes sp. TaxID=3088135 RepID=UPI002E1F48E1|nr:hypothetical protein [Flexistipes sp.]